LLSIFLLFLADLFDVLLEIQNFRNKYNKVHNFFLSNFENQRIPESRLTITLPLFASKDKIMIHVWIVSKSHATVIFP